MSTTSLRLPNLPPSSQPSSHTLTSTSLTKPSLTPSSPISSYRRLTLALLSVALTLGTAYSVLFNTYLDTSNPLLLHLPHPSHDSSYFARKSNVFNQVFVKRAWGWTSGVSVMLALAGRSSRGSQSPAATRLWIWRMALATLVWVLFTSWFFGPALFDRVGAYTGAECVVVVPFPSSPFSDSSPPAVELGEASANPGVDGLIGGKEAGVLLSVPIEFCHMHTTISAQTHADLFEAPFVQSYGDGIKGYAGGLKEGWKEIVTGWKGGRARLYKGHDVSGHIFLLTLCILFLTDQILGVLYPARTHDVDGKPKPIRKVHGLEAYAFQGTLALLALWWWMAIMTSVYFHTPQEKLSGFLIGVAGYLITRIPSPILSSAPPKVGVPIPDAKLRSDAMHLD